MSELIRNKRTCKLMPGLDTITGDLKAFKLQNTIIAGTREDTDDILNSILCHLVMFTKPERVSIEYYSYCNGLDTWGKLNITPQHFRNEIYANSPDTIWNRLEQILLFSLATFNESETEELMNCNTIIVLNELDKLLGTDRKIAMQRLDLIRALVSNSKTIGLSLIIVQNSNLDVYSYIQDLFTLRIAKEIPEVWSNSLFGYNIAKQNNSSKKYLWVMSNDKSFTIQRLRHNYYHETFLKNLHHVHGLSYSLGIWDKINNYKPLHCNSKTYVYLNIKKLIRCTLDDTMSLEDMISVFLKISYRRYETCSYSSLLEEVVEEVITKS